MTTLGITAGGILTVVRASVLVGLIMAVADYLVKRRKTNKGLRMSKHDVQQEYKQAEGDPHVKGHRRSMQMAMSRNRMMADIATADVVMVNPTHVAVALRYQPGRGAPVVVAKGAGVVAAKIRERAAEHRVPLVQDVPLARALHAACEVGQEIPAEALRRRRAGARVRHVAAGEGRCRRHAPLAGDRARGPRRRRPGLTGARTQNGQVGGSSPGGGLPKGLRSVTGPAAPPPGRHQHQARDRPLLPRRGVSL
nr:EscU/YscU/HrcU family type III secretion system export apparatus switch protein [Angustibacter aerolatus]